MGVLGLVPAARLGSRPGTQSVAGVGNERGAAETDDRQVRLRSRTEREVEDAVAKLDHQQKDARIGIGANQLRGDQGLAYALGEHAHPLAHVRKDRRGGAAVEPEPSSGPVLPVISNVQIELAIDEILDGGDLPGALRRDRSSVKVRKVAFEQLVEDLLPVGKKAVQRRYATPARAAIARVVTASTPASLMSAAAASRTRVTVSRLRAWTGLRRGARRRSCA